MKIFFLSILLISFIFIGFVFAEEEIFDAKVIVTKKTPVDTVSGDGSVINWLRVLNKNVYLGSTTTIDNKNENKTEGGSGDDVSGLSDSSSKDLEGINFSSFSGLNERSSYCFYKDFPKELVDNDNPYSARSISGDFMREFRLGECIIVEDNKGNSYSPVLSISTSSNTLWDSGSYFIIKIASKEYIFTVNSSGLISGNGEDFAIDEKKTLSFNLNDSKKLFVVVEADAGEAFSWIVPNTLQIDSISTN